MFPNDFAVHLHDTPARALFARAERAGWSAARIDETLRDGRRVTAAE